MILFVDIEDTVAGRTLELCPQRGTSQQGLWLQKVKTDQMHELCVICRGSFSVPGLNN